LHQNTSAFISRYLPNYLSHKPYNSFICSYLVPVKIDKTPADALTESQALAQHADRLGYLRYLLEKHHNMVGIASAATSVVIGYLAVGTEKVRIGADGIMLPNPSSLIIAEQFDTLVSLYPNRIDLGVGRAQGTDQLTWRVLRNAPRYLLLTFSCFGNGL
jgi:luciferase family oxidoreductase group 1